MVSPYEPVFSNTADFPETHCSRKERGLRAPTGAPRVRQVPNYCHQQMGKQRTVEYSSGGRSPVPRLLGEDLHQNLSSENLEAMFRHGWVYVKR